MNKFFIGLVLFFSINQNSFAQTSLSNEYPFNIPSNSTNRYFWIDIDKGNKIEIYINDVDDLDKFINMDSIIYGFLKDLKKFEDSLKDESTVKRIDYNLDDANNRKLRISQYRPAGTAYLVTDGEAAELKTRQDTINFTGKVDFVANYTLHKKFNDTRYFKVTFLLNSISDLAGYMNNTISQKIVSIKNNVNKKWENNDDRSFSPVADPSIKSNSIRGYNAGGDYLTVKASVDIQNYKAAFVPSASIGFGIILGGKNIRRQICLSSEYHFSFGKNAAGQNRTYINKFLTLEYERGYIKDNDVRKNNFNLLNFSYSYLIDRKGPLFEKNTSRLSAGTLSIFEGKTKIQPVLYLQGFFKSVTPGIRWVQSF
ncbi:MAG: hypothetical protein EOP53_08830 [Sphingobacteriales bacterium]|nr:MAG: hypothetical protein EOP53_08830 [Sphingobacteriales bacterium]